MCKYRHLTATDRLHIYYLRRMGHTMEAIARAVGVHKSTISRELNRNRGGRGYRPKQAHRLAQGRRCYRHYRYDTTTWQTIEALLHFKCSPEQASRRLALETGSSAPSHESIYRYIYEDKASGGDLHRSLRCQKRRRKRYGSGRDRRGQIVGRIDISQRPKIVDSRRRVGDWEADLMIGRRHRGALVTMVERKTRFTLAQGVANKDAGVVAAAVIATLGPHADRVKTITNDNGHEFAAHETIANALDADVYFSSPSAAWQRATSENTNGLLRQYFPKSRRLDKLPEHEVVNAIDQLNLRPRKCLNWKSPYEVYYDTEVNLIDVALRC